MQSMTFCLPRVACCDVTPVLLGGLWIGVLHRMTSFPAVVSASSHPFADVVTVLHRSGSIQPLLTLIGKHTDGTLSDSWKANTGVGTSG